MDLNAFLRPPRIDPNTEVCVAGRVDNTSTDPQIQLSWDVTDQSMLFLRYAEGFKSGGFSVGMSAPDVEQFVYHPEEAETLEVGVKSLLADARLEFNLVAFHTDFANRQVSALAPVFFGAPEFIIQNAAASTSTGFEFDGRWAASENLAITFSGAVLDSTYDSYPGAACNGYKRARRQDGCAVNRAIRFSMRPASIPHWRLPGNSRLGPVTSTHWATATGLCSAETWLCSPTATMVSARSKSPSTRTVRRST